MVITIINDCADANSAGRQTARAASLFNCPVSFIGVKSDLEAAGNLIDALDAVEDREGVALVNVAPRNGGAKKWGNGTPFGYFYYENILVVSTIDGLTLSLVKKLGVIDFVRILDVPDALHEMAEKGFLQGSLKARIQNSQFRSYDFLPRVALYLLRRGEVPYKKLDAREIPDAPNAIWLVDNFGNCKTTLLPEEVGFKQGALIKTRAGDLKCFSQLKDVPDGELALVIGSSGLGGKRFLEIVVQGGSAAEKFNLRLGDLIT